MTDEEWERLYRSNPLQTNDISDNPLYNDPRDNEVTIAPGPEPIIAGLAVDQYYDFPRSAPEHDRNVCPVCEEQFSDFKLLLAHTLEEHACWREGEVNILHDLKTHGTQRIR